MLVKPGFDLICVVFALFKLGAIPIVGSWDGLKKVSALRARGRSTGTCGDSHGAHISEALSSQFC